MAKDNNNILLNANEIIFNRKEEKQRQYGPINESITKAARVASELTNKDITTEDIVPRPETIAVAAAATLFS